ncbi:glycoside hydrolase family 32 protein [Sphingomonas koreensis]|nr:glycoside hydrolase family 32 protein [Sphingomonas koreensis]
MTASTVFPLPHLNGATMPDLARQDVPSAPLDRDADRYRPAFHFTPRKNWMNDPNGLVYFEGEYHLFYQYNPFGSQWGHMCWGHSVSPDLLHWTELPVAIPETDMMIFSGCAVVDRDNVSGLGDGDAQPLLAFFTAFDKQTEIQSQHLAYSHDRGRTFTHYRDNPLIDLDLLHFRDPKVFYHAPSHAWVMVVALSREHRVLFYRSNNLLDWTPAGTFGPAGSTSGQWECPDLMLVPIEGEPDAAKWVLKVDVDEGFIDGGSGAQYFIGDFDGHGFAIDRTQAPVDGAVVDFGPDFYAAVSWSDLPPEQPGPVWIGWMSNHQTGRHYPTEPWRGAQSLPRRLFLFRENGKLRLGQRPIDAVSKLCDQPHEARQTATDGQLSEATAEARAFVARVLLPAGDVGSASVQLRSNDAPLIEVSFDRDRQQLSFVRSNVRGLPETFARHSSTSCASEDDILIEFYVDNCLVEIFVNGGKRVYSGCVFPGGPLELTFDPASKRGSFASISCSPIATAGQENSG